MYQCDKFLFTESLSTFHDDHFRGLGLADHLSYLRFHALPLGLQQVLQYALVAQLGVEGVHKERFVLEIIIFAMDKTVQGLFEFQVAVDDLDIFLFDRSHHSIDCFTL